MSIGYEEKRAFLLKNISSMRVLIEEGGVDPTRFEVDPMRTRTWITGPCPGCGEERTCSSWPIEADAFPDYAECISTGCIMTNVLDCIQTCAGLRELSDEEAVEYLIEKNPLFVAAVKRAEQKAISLDSAFQEIMNKDFKRYIFTETANFYHARLKLNPDALSQQVKEFGETAVEKLKIGLAGGLVELWKQKFPSSSLDLLVCTGLAKIGKDGNYYDFFKSGWIIFPHFSKGKVLNFTARDPDQTKERPINYALKGEYRDEDWICYGQDALEGLEG